MNFLNFKHGSEINFVFMTDIHGRTNNPASRKDYFPDTILNKLSWVVNYANENDAIILCGGDWLNRPDTSPAFISKMCSEFNKAKYEIIGVLGNHDLYGYNIESFKRTPLAIAAACNNICILPENKSLCIELQNKKIYVSGSHSSPLIDRNRRTSEYYTPRRDISKSADEERIHIVHGFLTNKDWPDGVPYTKIDSILDTDADILLAGHEHLGFGILEKQGTVFCNPGALGRVSAAVGEINREVRIAHIKFQIGDSSESRLIRRMELIPLPSHIAQPADTVLDREKLEEEKNARNKIEVFAQQIQETNVENIFRSLSDPIEAINSILENDKFGEVDITDDIRRTVLEYIGKAEELEKK